MNDISTNSAVSSVLDLNQQRATKLAQSNRSPADESKMKKTASEFESILIAQWLQDAEKSFATVPGGDEEQQDPGHDQLQGIAIQHIAEAIAKSGGIGIGTMLTHFFERSQDANVGPSGTDSAPKLQVPQKSD
jgi:Rod binding domain-containing protein